MFQTLDPSFLDFCSIYDFCLEIVVVMRYVIGTALSFFSCIKIKIIRDLNSCILRLLLKSKPYQTIRRHDSTD
jgi:hypothetical protein